MYNSDIAYNFGFTYTLFSGTFCKPFGVTMDTRCESGEEASAPGEFLVGAGRCPAGT